MALNAGSRLGPYEIQSPLGAGGMGEVYRARDTRLDRTVAIKILASHSNSLDARRFEREARAISSLNHPNVCHLYDVGQQSGISYLVMEFLEGETLADRLRKGPLPLEQLVKYGVEICQGLETAHRCGVVHRDLKPSNIMLTNSGAKLMDFGLAKAVAAVVGVSSSSDLLATVSRPLTSEGRIVGTFQYMSPEQVEGKEVDLRSDIFSFGAVLYEMATGNRAFEGKTAASTIGAILAAEPQPISAIQPSSPAGLDSLIRSCLAKDPDERLQSIHDAKLQLKSVTRPNIQETSKPKLRMREATAWGCAAICISLLIWLGLTRFGSISPLEHRQIRLSLLPPESTSFVSDSFAISPDGRRVVFLAAGLDGGTKLWIRSLAASMGQELTGTEHALHPFWSGDSRQIGFFADGKLKTMDPSGGAIQIVCDAPKFTFGATWNQRGMIVFAPAGAGPLYRVVASGGTPQPVTKVERGQAHRWPRFLPDGDHFLYFVYNPEHSKDQSAGTGTYLGSLSSTESKVISSEIKNNTQFASGRILFVRDRSLMAQTFDLKRLAVSGVPQVVAQEVEPEPAFSFSASENGVVVFQAAADNIARLSWFDRSGKELDVIPATGYRDPALSRDGSLLAISSDDERNGKRFIRVYDFLRGTSTRLSDGGTERFPVLSPDNNTVAFREQNADSIYIVPTDNSRQAERLMMGVRPIPNDWSSDGRYLLYMSFPSFMMGLPELDVYDFRTHSQSLYAAFGAEAQFSPDGKWVSFASGGRPTSSNYQDSEVFYPDSEVFIAPFPGPGGRFQISNHGGAQARWRADGKELFYINADKKLMAVPIEIKGGKFVPGIPQVLFQTRIIAPRIVLFQYSVTKDGKRFLINSLPSIGAAPLTVITN